MCNQRPQSGQERECVDFSKLLTSYSSSSSLSLSLFLIAVFCLVILITSKLGWSSLWVDVLISQRNRDERPDTSNIRNLPSSVKINPKCLSALRDSKMPHPGRVSAKRGQNGRMLINVVFWAFLIQMTTLLLRIQNLGSEWFYWVLPGRWDSTLKYATTASFLMLWSENYPTAVSQRLLAFVPFCSAEEEVDGIRKPWAFADDSRARRDRADAGYLQRHNSPSTFICKMLCPVSKYLIETGHPERLKLSSKW